MINLLPEQEKENLRLKNQEKLFLIWGMMVSVFLICLILILLAIKFYVLIESDYQKNILEQAKKATQTADFINLSGEVQKYNGVLAQLDSFYKKEIYFSAVLETVTGISSPEGIFITDFSLGRNQNGVVQVSISGVSDTRDNLLVFKKNIEQDASIKNPYFSPESWINPKNVDFSLTLTIDKNGKP